MNKYNKLDALIITEIRSGKTHIQKLLDVGSLIEEAERVARLSGFCPVRWRVVERRLQALRKAGRIAHDRKTGWAVTEDQQ